MSGLQLWLIIKEIPNELFFKDYLINIFLIGLKEFLGFLVIIALRLSTIMCSLLCVQIRFHKIFFHFRRFLLDSSKSNRRNMLFYSLND